MIYLFLGIAIMCLLQINRELVMKKIKLIIEFIKLKHQGYNKEERYFKYAIKGLITFKEYEKYFDNKIKSEEYKKL